SIQTDNNENIVVNDGTSAPSGQLNITASVLSNIIAGQLVIGSTSQTGTVTVTGSLNTSGTPGTTPGSYKLTLAIGGTIDASAASVNIGNNPLVLTSVNAITFGSITAGTASVIL